MASVHLPTRVLALALALAAGPYTAIPAAAATFTVNRMHDAVDARPGDGVCETAPGNRICTLRAAIQEANARPGADTITVPGGTFILTLQNSGHEDRALNGDLDVTDSLTVVGAGAARTIITIGDPGPPLELERIFDIHGPIVVTIRDVTLLRGGRREGVGAGAGILNRGGIVAVERCVLTGNSSAGEGGGISNQGGTVTISNTLIEGNGGEVIGGGGIANSGGGTVIVTDSTIAGNLTDGSGAGILNADGTVMIVNSTIADNITRTDGSQGGAILNIRGGVIIATNTTFKGNRAGFQGGGDTSGGGIVNVDGTITLSNVTIAENGGPPVPFSVGGGLVNGPNGRITLHNSLLARNQAATGADCSGTITSLGYNIIGDLTGCTFLRGPKDNVGNPRIGDFVASTIPGRGHFPLEPGSPAIDRGLSPTCGAVDQLEQPRRDGNAMGGTQCDRGAVEFQP